MNKFYLLLLNFLIFVLPIFSSENKIDKPILFVIGTRPEAIKVLPVYKTLKENNISSYLCLTDQHEELVNNLLNIFDVKADFHFKIMKKNQTLSYLNEIILNKMSELISQIDPCLVIVQGDTTTAMASALAAFYKKVPIAHIEAGLRTNNIYSPFPEEINRRIISLVSTYHFAPTKKAYLNLQKENIDKDNFFLVGNTVVDAIHIIKSKIQNNQIFISKELQNILKKNKSKNKKTFLLTAHRREALENGLDKIFLSIKKALMKNPELFIIYPLHPNPKILDPLEKSGLKNLSNIQIISPLEYPDMIYLLENVDGVLTDSGGLQEEAATLNIPALVLRECTERKEGVECKSSIIVGFDEKKIIAGIETILNNPSYFNFSNSIYGDGTSSQQITNILKDLKNKGF
jgi:UDP-N-acetylglucosamine 2-epimerase (non-hydrolysing)